MLAQHENNVVNLKKHTCNLGWLIGCNSTVSLTGAETNKNRRSAKRPLTVVGSLCSHCLPGLMPECGTSRCVGFAPFITHLEAVQVAAMPDPPAAPLVVRGAGPVARGLYTASHCRPWGRQSRRGGNRETSCVKAETLGRHPNWWFQISKSLGRFFVWKILEDWKSLMRVWRGPYIGWVYILHAQTTTFESERGCY